MTTYRLAFKPSIGLYGQHDPSAVLFEDRTPVFGVEEERYTRTKHATETFPERAIQACLDYRNLELSDLERILLPYDPSLRSELTGHYVTDALRAPDWAESSLRWRIRSSVRLELGSYQRDRSKTASNRSGRHSHRSRRSLTTAVTRRARSTRPASTRRSSSPSTRKASTTRRSSGVATRTDSPVSTPTSILTASGSFSRSSRSTSAIGCSTARGR